MTAIPADYSAPPGLLKDRVVLVTGAGGGIGGAASRAFAGAGATVVLLGRTPEKLEAVYDSIEAAGGPAPLIADVDLLTATAADFDNLLEKIEQETGRLDGLLHNAALLGERRPVQSARPETWRDVMQVNVHAAMMLTRAALPLLQRSPSASVIFTSSGVGRRGRAYWGAYATSKFAVEGLMQVLAEELENTGPVRVNSLDPGAVRTAMRAAAFPGEDPATLPAPEDIMPAYLYLVGDDSLGVHGQALTAPGPRNTIAQHSRAT